MMWRDKGIDHDTVKDVEDWAKEKGILDKATPLAQAEKTLEEAEELRRAVRYKKIEPTKDGIGDVLVTIIIQAKMQSMTLQDCLDHAYEQIKNRTGKMVNGQYVKTEDLQGGD